MTGTLYGVGVGPGDPELITRKAARLISSAGVVAYPAANGQESFARAIAADLIAADAVEIRMDVPMERAREPAQAAYDLGAEAMATHLSEGRDVVTLCEGDPLFYGSFMYLMDRLKDRFPVEVVPGVTSVSASAAAIGHPLTARTEVLTVLPGTLEPEAMEDAMQGADAVAVLKLGRHLEKVKEALARAGFDGATYIERASLADEITAPLRETERAPYFSLVLARKGRDPWLR